jgi:uncharacterized membrane protein
MFFDLIFWLKSFRHNLTFRAGIFAILAIAFTFISFSIASAIPDSVASFIRGQAVDQILTIFASSMLAIVAFSLSALVSTYALIGNYSPPRVTKLVIQDSAAHTALSTFIGIFIFSIVSLVVISTKYYGPKVRIILFFVIVVLLIIIVITMIRWIGQLTNMSRLDSVINKIEASFEESLKSPLTLFDWQVPANEPKGNFTTLKNPANNTGFLQTINLEKLNSICKKNSISIFLKIGPGDFLSENSEIAKLTSNKEIDKKLGEELVSCFTIGASRTQENDLRYSLILLSETASRALSPAINDPGTAIQIITHLVRMIEKAVSFKVEDKEHMNQSMVFIKPITGINMLNDSFRSIARDGAKVIEVNLFLQKSFLTLAQFPVLKNAAIQASQESFSRAKVALDFQSDLEILAKSKLET